MNARLLLALTLGCLAALLPAGPTTAQDAGAPADTTVAPADTTVAPADTTERPPALRPDTAEVMPGGPPRGAASTGGRPSSTPNPGAAEGAVQFAATDSLVLTFDQDAGDVGTLYGQSEVTYGEATLSAYQIAILMARDELQAAALEVDTGLVGTPQFQRGGSESFSGRTLAYNIRSERGRVVQAQTSIQDGFIEGEVVKVDQDSTVYVQDGCYTTCPCACVTGEASYSLRSNRMKQQDEWVYTGPLHLYLFNIPTPLWLPFGFLPSTERRHGGFLPPSYGDDGELGLYLRDWGWYWAISDYMDLQLRFGVWTRGSWQVNPTFRYAKRYRYTGNLDVSYLHQERGDPIDADYGENQATSIRWRHNQTISPTSSLNANVNLSSRTHLQQVSNSYEDNVTQETSSTINYSKRWDARSLNATLSHRQNFASGAVSMTIPDLSFRQRNFQPLAREELGPGEEERWYERITTSYRGDLSNRYRFDPFSERDLVQRGDTVQFAPDSFAFTPEAQEILGISWYEALVSPEKYRRATGETTPFDLSVTHDVPVSASFTVGRVPLTNIPMQLSLTPNIQYAEEWFVQTERRGLETRAVAVGDSTRIDTVVVRDDVPGFFALREFSAGVSANTSIYGLFPLQLGPYRDLRHVARLTSSLSYSPDYYGDFWGYTREYVDREGEVVQYPLVPGVRRGEQRSLNFSVDNEFQTRRVRVDSTGEQESRTVKLLDLDASASYNFAADSLQLSAIRMNARTNLADNKYRLSLSTTWSPYIYRDGRPIDAFIAANSFALAWLQSLRFSLSTQFEGGDAGGVQQTTGPDRGRYPGQRGPGGFPGPDALDPMQTREDFGYPLSGAYADFSVPWSLDLRFNYGYTNRSGQDARYDAKVNVGYQFSVTPKWRLSGNTGYDFIDRELAATQLRVMRDLGCWQMSFNWTPTGRFQQYGFSLYVKSGQLSDLLRLDLPRSGVKDRFQGAAQGAIRGGAF